MDTKTELLTAALKLFATEGYENAGIQKIVDAVNVKKPTLYYYFGNKQGVLVALLERYFEPFLQELQSKAVYQGDVTMTLESILNTYFRFAMEFPEFYRFVLSILYAPRESEISKTIYPILEKQYKILETTFLHAANDHGNMRGRSKRYAITFLGMINSYVTTYYYGQIALSEESAYVACKQFMHGIFS